MESNEIALKLAILERIGRDLDEILWQGHLLALELALRAYNPDQPRVPAGNPDGGQWTSEEPDPNDPPPRRWTSGSAGGNLDSAGGGDKLGRLGDLGDGSSSAEGIGQGLENVQYRGRLHDEIRDDLADRFRKKGFTVATEVPVN